MSLARQALAIAHAEAGPGASDDKAMVLAWNRLSSMLSVLDSKTSVLLRFNAIVVAALAYLVVVRGSDPFVASSATVKAVGLFVGHVSLVVSVVSCGFAFPVINVAWSFFGSRIDRISGDVPAFDAAVLAGLAELVVHRTRFYSWAWRFAVAGGVGFAVLVGLATIH